MRSSSIAGKKQWCKDSSQWLDSSHNFVWLDLDPSHFFGQELGLGLDSKRFLRWPQPHSQWVSRSQRVKVPNDRTRLGLESRNLPFNVCMGKKHLRSWIWHCPGENVAVKNGYVCRQCSRWPFFLFFSHPFYFVWQNGVLNEAVECLTQHRVPDYGKPTTLPHISWADALMRLVHKAMKCNADYCAEGNVSHGRSWWF